MAKNSGGRPRHGEHVKSVPLGIRTDPELRERIEAAAEERGVSLTQEVERRLRDSFQSGIPALPQSLRDKLEAAAKERAVPLEVEVEERLMLSLVQDSMFGSTPTARLLRVIGATVDALEGRTGAKWYADPKSWLAMKAAIIAVIDVNHPGSPPQWESSEPERIKTEREDVLRQAAELRARMDELASQNPFWEETFRRFAAGERPTDVDAELRSRFGDDLLNEVTSQQVQMSLQLDSLSERARELNDQYNAAMAPRRQVTEEAVEIGRDVVSQVLNALRVTPEKDKP